MTTALTTYVPNRDEWQTMVTMAASLAASGVVPRHINKPEAAVAIILQGRELGIGAMQALRTIHLIEGRLSLSADLMAALIYAKCGDNAMRVVERSDNRCVIAYQRPGWPTPVEMVWTMEMAKNAGLTGKDNWKRYPAAMLFSRCVSAVAHTAFQDVIMGLYSIDEVEEIAETEKQSKQNAVSNTTTVTTVNGGVNTGVQHDAVSSKPAPKPRQAAKPKPATNAATDDHGVLVAMARATLSKAAERDPGKWSIQMARAFIERAFKREVRQMDDLSDSELVTFISMLDGTLAYDYESGQLLPDHISGNAREVDDDLDTRSDEPDFAEAELVNMGADDVRVSPDADDTDDAY